MDPQRAATGIGVGALAALMAGVGLPAVLPPPAVEDIEIVIPVGDVSAESDDLDDSPDDSPHDSPDDSPDE